MGAVVRHRVSRVVGLFQVETQEFRGGTAARVREARPQHRHDPVTEVRATRPSLSLTENPQTYSVVNETAGFHAIRAVKERKLVLGDVGDIAVLRVRLDQGL